MSIMTPLDWKERGGKLIVTYYLFVEMVFCSGSKVRERRFSLYRTKRKINIMCCFCSKGVWRRRGTQII